MFAFDGEVERGAARHAERRCDEGQRRPAAGAGEPGGIDPGAVRFSIGLEDAEDLISDAYVALESLSRP